MCTDRCPKHDAILLRKADERGVISPKGGSRRNPIASLARASVRVCIRVAPYRCQAAARPAHRLRKFSEPRAASPDQIVSQPPVVAAISATPRSRTHPGEVADGADSAAWIGPRCSSAPDRRRKQLDRRLEDGGLSPADRAPKGPRASRRSRWPAGFWSSRSPYLPENRASSPSRRAAPPCRRGTSPSGRGAS